MNDDDEIVQAFLEESGENLDQLERDLVALETNPGEPGLLARVYRAIHTVKGTCGFLGYHRLEALTHAGENVLDGLRSGAIKLDAHTTSALLALVDAVRVVLDRIATTGQEGDDPHTGVIETLTAVAASGVTTNGAGGAAVPRAPTTPQPAPRLADPRVAPEVRPVQTDSSVRVDVTLLDNLMDLVGELVLAGNRIGAVVEGDGPLWMPYRQLRLVTSELQEQVMRARLQPIGRVTGKFRRIVRDLAASEDKEVLLELEGEDVGVDKAVNEALNDPLLHLVRNAIDHGLESPVDRIAAGKDPAGRLRIRTFHEGGLVHLEVSDDGRGVDADRLAASAVRAGFLSAEAAAQLDREQTLELMFRPGLSTTDHVTTISGRGVGLDVVRTHIEQVGGSIEVTTEVGLGTKFRISVPLTLATMTAVMVWSRGGRYALPQVHVQEVVHLDPEAMSAAVSDIGAARVLTRRGELIPLLDLADQLALSHFNAAGDAVASSAGMDVVLVDIVGRHFGVVVDAVGESIEAVVKPLTRATRSISVFAGVTILGDGQPSLIIDLAGLAAAAGLRGSSDAGTATEQAQEVRLHLDTEQTNLLVARIGRNGRVAVPLAAVLRLEEFDCDQLEYTGRGGFVQYDGAVLPIVYLGLEAHRAGQSDVAAGDSASLSVRSDVDGLGTPDALQTIVCRSSAGPVGIVVDRIEDVVTAPATLLHGSSQLAGRSGVTACVVIDERITEVLDVEALVEGVGLELGRRQ